MDSASTVAGRARRWEHGLVNRRRVAALAWGLCVVMAVASGNEYDVLWQVTATPITARNEKAASVSTVAPAP